MYNTFLCKIDILLRSVYKCLFSFLIGYVAFLKNINSIICLRCSMINHYKIPEWNVLKVICFIVEVFDPRQLMSMSQFNGLIFKFIKLRGNL